MTRSSVARVSDDFYPRDPASSSAHLAACIFNGLFMSVLVQPDWDMFHSAHPVAELHAMAR
jgi:raffinose synthase